MNITCIFSPIPNALSALVSISNWINLWCHSTGLLSFSLLHLAPALPTRARADDDYEDFQEEALALPSAGVKTTGFSRAFQIPKGA